MKNSTFGQGRVDQCDVIVTISVTSTLMSPWRTLTAFVSSLFRYLSLLNQYLENVPIEHGYNVSQEQDNLAVHAQEFRVKYFEGAGAASLAVNKVQRSFVVYDNAASVQPFSSQASLTIPKSLFEGLNIESKDQKKRLYFAVFRKTPFFQSSRSNNKIVRKNSFVIAGSVKGGEIRNLTDPVVTAYYPLDKAINESAACVFWDFGLKRGLGDWSGDGCYYKGTTDGLVTCNCNHLTNYAILMVRLKLTYKNVCFGRGYSAHATLSMYSNDVYNSVL